MGLWETEMIRTFASIAAFALVAVPALATANADEAWKTKAGTVAWINDIGGDAVLSVDAKGGKTLFYIDGLKSKMEGGRSKFSGYWISTKDAKICDTTMTTPDGIASRSWGRLELLFVKPGFPSDWVMKTGSCFGDTTEMMSGIAIVGK
jgi:hypothetical protein